MPNGLRLLRSLGLVVLAITVVFIESNFDRPSQSVRPQVGESKAVDWRFQLRGTVTQVVRTSAEGEVIVTFTDLDGVVPRFKNSSESAMSSPIQVYVLLNSLSEGFPGELTFALKSLDGGTVIPQNVPVSGLWYRDGLLQLALASGVDFDDVDIADARPYGFDLRMSVQSCQPKESFVSCPFADFSGANLARGDFERANLRGVDISGADLRGAKLGFADLSGAIGLDVDMSGAWLLGIDVDDAFLERVNYSGAVWSR